MGGEGDKRGWDGLHHQFNGQGLCKLWELVMDREAWRATVHGLQRVGHHWATELNCYVCFCADLFLFLITVPCINTNESFIIWYKISESHSVVSDSLWPHGLCSPWNSPGQNTGVSGLSLLQGIFPTQGPNPALLHYRWILYQLSHHGSPRMLEWIAYPFSGRSSQPRNQTRVSCIAGSPYQLN